MKKIGVEKTRKRDRDVLVTEKDVSGSENASYFDKSI
jgi:hypothetical protein